MKQVVPLLSIYVLLIFFLGLFFDPEDEEDVFLRNVG
jgi:hypothetical protein